MRRLFVLSIIGVLLSLALGACASDVSSNFGRYFQGRFMYVSLVSLERVPELRYSTIDPQENIKHWSVQPSDPANELILLRLKVQNHDATSATFEVDESGAELLDLAATKYFPINISDRVEETPEPPGREGKSVVFVWGPFELEKDMGIDGWMVFEAPKDTRFREFRWRAGDSLTIRF